MVAGTHGSTFGGNPLGYGGRQRGSGRDAGRPGFLENVEPISGEALKAGKLEELAVKLSHDPDFEVPAAPWFDVGRDLR